MSHAIKEVSKRDHICLQHGSNYVKYMYIYIYVKAIIGKKYTKRLKVIKSG